MSDSNKNYVIPLMLNYNDEFEDIPETIKNNIFNKGYIYYKNTNGEYIRDVDKEKEVIDEEKDYETLNNLNKSLNNEQRILLDKFLIRLISASDLFNNEEKQSVGIIKTNIIESETKELEINNKGTIYFDDSKTYEVGVDYKVGECINYNNNIYKVIQSHKSQSDWSPDKVPALYSLKKEIQTNTTTKQDNNVLNFVQPTGGHDAYGRGDKVLFNGKTYESLINGNVWSPTDYPAGWEVIK
jgi:hypothetical protein